jgi:hypothetical protein
MVRQDSKTSVVRVVGYGPRIGNRQQVLVEVVNPQGGVEPRVMMFKVGA